MPGRCACEHQDEIDHAPRNTDPARTLPAHVAEAALPSRAPLSAGQAQRTSKASVDEGVRCDVPIEFWHPGTVGSELRNPKSHSYGLWPAGSFFGYFRTPPGARNSSRKQAGHWSVSLFKKPEMLCPSRTTLTQARRPARDLYLTARPSRAAGRSSAPSRRLTARCKSVDPWRWLLVPRAKNGTFPPQERPLALGYQTLDLLD